MIYIKKLKRSIYLNFGLAEKFKVMTLHCKEVFRFKTWYSCKQEIKKEKWHMQTEQRGCVLDVPDVRHVCFNKPHVHFSKG